MKTRPPTAHLLRGEVGDVTGVLVCRAEGSTSQEMAVRALQVDGGWSHEEAVAAILAADIRFARWYKTPHPDGGWHMIDSGYTITPVRGATPGVYYDLIINDGDD